LWESRRDRQAYVADGGKCVGFALRRGRTGYEAFDVDEKSLGLFASESEAAEVVLGKLEHVLAE
jgi:hypothetical protein